MNTLLHPRFFLRFSLTIGSTIIAAGLLSNWLWPEILPRAHAVQVNQAALDGVEREFAKKKKKRRRKTKTRGGRRGGLGSDFEGGGGGSYHTNGLASSPERLAAP